MRSLSDTPISYFNKFKDKPVHIKPFDPSLVIIAQKYIKKLKKILFAFNPQIVHRGSTAFGIAGKNEIELGVYPKPKDWQKIIDFPTEYFGQVNNIEKNYARFNDIYNDTEIEIILMKGYDATVDKKLFSYLVSHPDLLKKYEKLKYKYCYSKKDYMIQKDKFFRNVIKDIP